MNKFCVGLFWWGDKMKKVILLSGIHGVGKGFISKQIEKKINIPIYEASKLICSNGGLIDKNKKVNNVNSNQDLLVDSINNLVDHDLFILDGHTCLINNENHVELIDIDIFRRINVIGIILVYDDINIISERLAKRDNTNFDKLLLNDLQKAEVLNTEKLSKELSIPLLFFKNGDDINRLINFIKDL